MVWVIKGSNPGTGKRLFCCP